jgi:hypothetical protein
MRASLWVSKTGGFPQVYRGFLSRREREGVFTLVLSEVDLYTWENYHGKPLPKGIPEDQALWKYHAETMLFIGFNIVEQDEKQIRYHNKEGDTCITVFPLVEKP